MAKVNVTLDKPYLRNALAFRQNVFKGRIVKGASLTVPGRTMTLRQIADRFASGLQITDQKVALYDEGKTVIKGFESLI